MGFQDRQVEATHIPLAKRAINWALAFLWLAVAGALVFIGSPRPRILAAAALVLGFAVGVAERLALQKIKATSGKLANKSSQLRDSLLETRAGRWARSLRILAFFLLATIWLIEAPAVVSGPLLAYLAYTGVRELVGIPAIVWHTPEVGSTA